MIPLDVDWRCVVLTLRTRHGTYHAILDEIAKQGHITDHSTLVYLAKGDSKAPRWRLGAALLNLYSAASPSPPVPSASTTAAFDGRRAASSRT